MIRDHCNFNDNADHNVGQFWTAGSPNKVRAGPDGVADDWFGKGSPCLDTTITILITTKTTSSQPPLPSPPSSPKTPGGSLEQPGQTQPSKVTSEDNKPFFGHLNVFLMYDEYAPLTWKLSIDRRAKKNLWFVNLGICTTSSRFFEGYLDFDNYRLPQGGSTDLIRIWIFQVDGARVRHHFDLLENSTASEQLYLELAWEHERSNRSKIHQHLLHIFPPLLSSVRG